MPAIGNPVKLGESVDSYDAVVVSGTTSLPAAPANVTTVVIGVEGGDVRYRDDSGTPVEAVDATRRGLVLPQGTLLASSSPSRLRFIVSTGAPYLSIEWRK